MLNPTESKVSSIKVNTEHTDDVVSTDENAPKVTFENDIEYVEDLTITIVSKDNQPTQKLVKLSILACLQNTSVFTKGAIETTSELMFPYK